MPRPPRIISVGDYYHVVSRGNNGCQLFYASGDFSFFVESLAEYLFHFKVSLFNYCFMTNHIHLLVRQNEDNNGIVKTMQGLKLKYALYYQKRNRATGTVWEGRYKNFLISSGSYLLECARYIERNPVKAGIIDDPGEYSFSSYRHYSRGLIDDLITDDNSEYLGLSASPEERRVIYTAYVETARASEGKIGVGSLEVI